MYVQSALSKVVDPHPDKGPYGLPITERSEFSAVGPLKINSIFGGPGPRIFDPRHRPDPR